MRTDQFHPTGRRGRNHNGRSLPVQEKEDRTVNHAGFIERLETPPKYFAERLCGLTFLAPFLIVASAVLSYGPAYGASSVFECTDNTPGGSTYYGAVFAHNSASLGTKLSWFRNACQNPPEPPGAPPETITLEILVRCNQEGWLAEYGGNNGVGESCGYSTRAAAEKRAKEECYRHGSQSCVLNSSSCDDGTLDTPIGDPMPNSEGKYYWMPGDDPGQRDRHPTCGSVAR